jgi:hypothetical protein
MSALLVNELPVTPLGAGDLIDRAVRLYRSHFFTLIRIASPPVVMAAAGSVLSAISWRLFTATSSEVSLVLLGFLTITGFVIWAAGNVFSLIVMGGATRNLVTHLLSNEAVSARATYAAVRSRFWGLLVATVCMMLWVGIASSVTLFAWYMVLLLVVFGSVMLGQIAPAWLAGVVGAVGFIASSVLSLWLLFFLTGRIAYVPQAMLVEGKGVFEAIGRSFSLASGNVRRLMAMALFTSFAFYSALMILIVPLGWFGYVSGVDLSPLNQGEWPAWYTIGYNVIFQTSHLLLAPVWMLGLSLLYVDERVRHEGYDIELMAARQLSAMPSLAVTSPLAPALSAGPQKTPPPPMATGSVLGLR